MKISLKYGQAEPAQITLTEEQLLAHCDASEQSPLDDLSAAVQAAINSPLEYPPLLQAVIAGDRVALALEPSLPGCAEIVAQLVNSLLETGIAAADIAVIQTEGDPNEPLKLLPEQLQNEINKSVHQADDRDQLAYIAVSKQGEPVMMNRQIADAEFVITVGSMQANSMASDQSVHRCIYPNFSDVKAQQKYRSAASVESAVSLRRRNEEAEEAAFLLGLQFTVQVVPAANDKVAAVIAGNPKSVSQQGYEGLQKIWHHEIPHRAELVIAGLSANESQQTWENVAKILSLAARLTEDGGIIALCTSLNTKPGAALQLLIASDDLDEAIWEIRKQRGEDAIAAIQLANILKSKRVFLMSQLDEQIVEALQLGHIDKPDQLSHIAARAKSCVVLSNAHLLEVTVAGESANPEDFLADIDRSLDF